MRKLPPRIWAYLIGLVVMIIVGLALFGCSCNYHLEKARQKCGTTHFTDTIRVHDTTFITQDFHDTTFFYQTHDTVIMKDGRLVVKYFYHDSTVYLQGKCIADTIVKEVRVPCETTTLNFSWSEWLKKYLFWIIATLVVGFAVWKLRP